MSNSASRALRALSGLALAAALGCDAGPHAAVKPEDAKAAAKIGQRTITIGELDAHIKNELFEQASEGGEPAKLYELRSEAVEQMIDERLVEARPRRAA